MRMFQTPSKLLTAIGAMLLIGPPAQAAAATAQSQVKSMADGIPMEQRLEALRQLSDTYCSQEYEHAIPGIYYYCVGIRDIARGKTDRARTMLEIAASWGSKSAEFTLGVGYYKGDVQPLDRGRGLAWLGIAAERQNPGYAAVFKSAWDHATPEERARGNVLWQELLPTYGDKRAGRRAERRYRSERIRMLANSVYGAVLCFSGRNGQIASSGQGSGRVVADSQGRTQFVRNESSADGSDISCGPPVEVAVHKMDHFADSLLDGWEGHVTVGPLQEGPGLSR